MGQRSRKQAGLKPTDRTGSALLAAVFVVAMVAVMSMAYLQLSLNKNREQKAAVDAKRAFYIAEAGLSEALLSIAAGQSGNVGSEALPARFGDGVFFVTAKDEGGGKTTLTSVGLCGCGRSAVSLVIDVKKEGVAALGVFSDGTVTIGRNALIDSYDSRQGSYSSQHPGPPPLLDPPTASRVASNGNIVVHGPAGLLGALQRTAIYGYTRPGPNGSVLRDGSVLITGSTAPNDTHVVLPEISVPDAHSAGDLTVTSDNPLTLSAGEFGYRALRVAANGRAEIVGPANVVVSGLELRAGSQLTFDARNGPVRLYVRDHVDLEAGSTLVSTSENPSAVALMIDAEAAVDRDGDGIPDPPVKINSTGNFYGTIFAPKAAVSVPSTLVVYGAIAAKQLSLLAGARVHFDLALIDASASDSTVPHTIGWRLVPLPKSPLVSLRYDVLKLLELEGVVPTVAPRAHVAKGVTPATVPPDDWNAIRHLLDGVGLGR